MNGATYSPPILLEAGIGTGILFQIKGWLGIRVKFSRLQGRGAIDGVEGAESFLPEPKSGSDLPDILGENGVAWPLFHKSSILKNRSCYFTNSSIRG